MIKLFVFVSLIVCSYSGSALAKNSEIAVGSTAVEYVRICSKYGYGFHYIPGTDTCLQESTGVTQMETQNGTVYGQTELARRVEALEAQLTLISKQLATK